MKHSKKIIASLLSTAFLMSAGCSKKIGIPGDKDADVTSSEPYEITLPCSGQKIKVARIQDDQLVSGETYTFSENMKLVIQGSVPEKTSVYVQNGQLEVTGDLKMESSISVRVPEFTHTETYVCMKTHFNGKTTTMTPGLCYKTVTDGPKPPYDCDEAIIVNGKVDKTANMHSSYKTKIKTSNNW